MKRLTHHQYTRISMIGDVLESLALTETISLYVDTWRSDPDTYARVALIEEQALLGSVDGEWYSKTILGLMLAEDGAIIGDEGGVLRLNDHDEITLGELAEYLTGYTTTED